MPENEVKKILSEVIAFLNRGNLESSALWSVLTALRGPDNEDYALKLETTARIRGALGLVPSGPLSGLTVSYVAPTIIANDRFDHFTDHYLGALAALRSLRII